MPRLGPALALVLCAALAPAALAQVDGADDAVGGGADAADRAADGAFDAADTGVGAASDARRERDVDGAGFDEDTAAVNRTYGEPAPNDDLGAPEGTVQEAGEFVDGILR